MKQTLKYVAYYDSIDSSSDIRKVAHSSVHKIDSIIDNLLEAGYNVDIISMASVRGKKNSRGSSNSLKKGLTLKLFYSLGRKSIIHRIFNQFFIRLQFFLYLLFHTKKSETIIVYHSLAYMKIILILKRIKKFKLILELEEIYGDVIGCEDSKRLELKLSDKADAYIYPTQLLNSLTNKNNKPHVIIHGAYNFESKRNNIFNDDKIHVLYAGTFDQRKGCITVAQAAEFLNDKYHLHIIGFGQESEINHLKKTILHISSKSKCAVTYDGEKIGEEYIQYAQSCQIGLSPQTPTAEFNATSFPSKVLSYMCNGLRVVSIRIAALETSHVSDLLYYYDSDSPEELAKAIKQVDLNDSYDSRAKLKELNRKSMNDLKKMIQSI